LDIRANQLDTLVNQLDTPVSQQLTPAKQLVILTSLLPILPNQEDILQPMLAILVQGACHTHPSLLKGCLVCFTQPILMSLDQHLAKVATNNTMQTNRPTHSHPQHQPLSTLL